MWRVSMKLRTLLEKYGVSLKLKTPFLTAKITFKNHDRNAAWELYVELLTRITTQQLPEEDGDEQIALDSVYAIFGLTRNVLKKYGAGTIQFSKIAIPVLNQIVRPFTAKWHKLSTKGAFADSDQCKAFREDLKALQQKLRNYNRMLAYIAEVEDLTSLEDVTLEIVPSRP